ncbi:MAG: glycosyltransferase family 4 protein [Acidobacteria bacterium]|nr:glycosyltransferase family 4 protein [Acidobacteriota bacterium]
MEKLMHICLVSQEYPPETARGGIGTQTWNKARALARLGHTVHVLSCAARPGPDVRAEVDAGITVHRMQPPGFEFPVYEPHTYWLGYTWSVLRQLRRLMETTPFDMIDFAEYGAEGFAYQLDRTPWNWVPVVVQLHGPLSMFAERIGWPDKDSAFHRVGTFMEGVSIKHADGLMACSANIADFTSRFYGVPRESIDVVHCGVDAEAFRPGAEDERDEGRPTMLFVGNIAANKGVDTIFEAVLRLRSKYPGIRLQILGKGDDGHVEELQSRAGSAGAGASIEFPGFVGRDQLPVFYRRAHVFASPAQHEVGVANVYIEAMASGCPVVASTTGGASEAVISGQMGFLVPPGDVEATSVALDRILSDVSLRRRMGEAGRKRVEDYFAMDKYIRRVLATYQKTMDRSQKKLEWLKAKMQ